MPEYLLATQQSIYRFDLLLEIISRFAYPARWRVAHNRLWRVTAGYPVSYYQVNDRIYVEMPVDADVDQVIAHSQFILGCTIDLRDFYDRVQNQSELWSIIKPLYGLPLFLTETVYEALITLIIEQHISWTSALRAQKNLLQLIGTPHTIPYGEIYDFPSPHSMSQQTIESLKPLKITYRRMQLIIDIASDLQDQRLSIEDLHKEETDKAYQTLLKLKGVGHWTANNVLSRALGRFPYISYNDVALQSAVSHYFYADTKSKSAQLVIDTLQPYGDIAGLVAHFTLLRWVYDRYPIITSNDK